MEKTPFETPSTNNHEQKNIPENAGVVLGLAYANGCRSTQEFNEKLSKHYQTPFNLTQKEIVDILTKRNQTHANHFDPNDIEE